MAATITGIDSSWPSILFRAIVLLASLTVLLSAVKSGSPGKLPIILYFFLFLYALRLLYDWLVANIDGADVSLFHFLFVAVIPVAAVNLFARRITEDALFARTLVAFGLIFCLLTIFASFTGLSYNPWADQGTELERFQVFKVNPISIGLASGSVVLAVVYLLVETQTTIRYRLVLLLTATLGCYILLISNSRGPLIAFSIAFVWFLAGRIRRTVYVLPVIVIIAGTIYSNLDIANDAFGRFTLDYTSDGSLSERVEINQAAIQSFLNFPIFGQHFLDPQFGEGRYPHNILIETGMALGLVGVVLLVITVAKTAIYVMRSFGRQHSLYTALLLQAGTLSQTSGTLWAVDAFYFLVGTVLVVTSSPQRRRFPVAVPAITVRPAGTSRPEAEITFGEAKK